MNFYDRPAQSEFVNTYVPIPFEEIMQAGAARQGRYDQTMSAMQANQEYLDQLQAIEGTVHEDYLNKSRQDIDAIARAYANKDLSQSLIKRQLRDDVRRRIDPATINRIVQSKKNFDEAQKQKFQLDAQGLYFEPYDRRMDPALNKTLTLADTYDYTPRAFQDPENYAGNTYFKVIEPKRASKIEGAEVMATEVRDKAMIDAAVEQNYGSFASTPQGQWAIENYKALHPDKAGMGDDVIAKEYLREVGYNKWLVNNKMHAGWVPEYMTKGPKGSDDVRPLDASSNTQSIVNTNRVPSKEMDKTLGFNLDKIEGTSDLLDELEFDNNGMLSREKIDENRIFLFPWEGSKEGKAKKAASKQKAADEIFNTRKDIVNNIKNLNKTIFDGKSDLEVLKAYSEAYKGIDQVDFNTYLYNTDEVSTSEREILTRQILPSIAGRKLTISETGKTSGKTVNTLTDLYDELDIPKEDRKLENIKITSIVPALGGYEASIVSEGQPKNFIISPNKKEQYITSLVAEATKRNIDGKVGEKEFELNGKNYIVTTRLDLTGDGYGFVSNVRTKDGSELLPGLGKDRMPLLSLEGYTAEILRALK